MKFVLQKLPVKYVVFRLTLGGENNPQRSCKHRPIFRLKKISLEYKEEN